MTKWWWDMRHHETTWDVSPFQQISTDSALRFLPESFGSFSCQVWCSQAVPAVRRTEKTETLRKTWRTWEKIIKIWERSEKEKVWTFEIRWASSQVSTSLNESHRGSTVSQSAWAVVNRIIAQHSTSQLYLSLLVLCCDRCQVPVHAAHQT